MPIPSGILSEVYDLQRPVETRNAAGESVPTWETVATIYGSYEAISYAELARRGQIGGSLQATVRMRHRDGVLGNMRLVWKSGGGRVLMITSIVPKGRRDEIELTVEETAA